MARGRCDHDPRAPRLALVVDAIPNQPKFNRDGIARSRRMFDHGVMFPELTGHAIVGAGVRLRARRSSRREAHALMSAAIWRHTDNRTSRIGTPRGDAADLCNGISVKRYMEETGLSRGRVNAVLREFEGAGYIVTATQPVEALQDHRKGCDRTNCSCPPLLDDQGKQRHRAYAAQRHVTDLFFQRHAFTAERIEAAKAKAYQAWRKRREAPASAVAVLEGRRAVSKLMKNNRRRNRRIEAGRAPAYAPAARPAPFDPARQSERDEARLKRLEARLRPPTPPPAKPPSSR